MHLHGQCKLAESELLCLVSSTHTVPNWVTALPQRGSKTTSENYMVYASFPNYRNY